MATSSNGVVLSPQRQTFTYEQHDARLPPDLLPYGPQALSLQNSAAATLEHKNHQYNVSFENGVSISCSTDGPSGSGNKTTYTNGSTQDLRIYHPCNGNLSTGMILSSPKSLTPLSSVPQMRTNYEYMVNNGQNSINSGKISPTTVNTNTIITTQQQQQQQQPFQSVQSTNSTKLIDNGCKPRQSIVRTSPSFSFLSTGYQQQDNFL